MGGSNVGNRQDSGLTGTVFPALSAAGSARLVYMPSFRTWFISQNGGPFVIAIGIPLAWGAASPALNNFLGRYSYAQSATQINGQIPAPVTGSLYGFSVRADDANFSATATLTVQKAAANTTLTVGVTNAVNKVLDSTHTATVVRGDLLSVRLTVSGLTNRIWAGVYLAPGG